MIRNGFFVVIFSVVNMHFSVYIEYLHSICQVIACIFFQLVQGVLVKVSPSLVKRRKTHFHNLPCGVSIILGNNGFIWICPTVSSEEDNCLGGFTQNLKEVTNTFC